MSSLAAQLAQSASLNSALLVDRTRRKPTASYLFTGREADQHDLESIHALGVNALLQLSSVDHSLSKYEADLFSGRAKDIDRTLLTEEQIEELDEALEAFLLVLGPYLMEALTGRILEWLVRRFRINEFNIEAILSLFLPYHESPHFTKMVTILNIKSNSTWSFLLPYKSAAQKLPRVSLVTEMLRNSEVARFVASLLPAAVKKGVSHPALVAFNAAALHEFMNRSTSLEEGNVAYLLPAILEPLEHKPKITSTDSILGSFILLAALSQKAELSLAALKVIVSSMVKNAHLIRGDQIINSLVAVCKSQPELDKFADGSLKGILKIPSVAEEVANALCWTGSEKLISPLVKSLSLRLSDDTSVAILEGVVAAPVPHHDVIGVLANELIKTAINPQAATQDSLTARRLLSRVQQRSPNVLQKVAENLCEADDAVREAVEQLIISLYMREQISSHLSDHEGIDMILASANADGKVRTLAVKDLIKGITGKDLSALEEVRTVQHSLLARLQDNDFHVLEALYEDPTAITPLFTLDAEAFISALELAIATPTVKPRRNVLRIHLTYLTSHFWAKVDSAHQEAIFHRILFPFLLFSKSRQKSTEVVWDIIHCHVPELPGSAATDWIAGCSSLTKAGLSESGESIDLMSVINTTNSERIAENILVSNNFHAHLEILLAKLKDSNSYTKLLGYLVALSLVKRLVGEHQIEAAYKIMQVMDIQVFTGVDDLPENADADALNAFPVGRSVVTKPNSRSSLDWLHISIVKAITEIPRPTNLTLNWLMETTADAEDRSSRYIQLMRRVYHLANVSTTLPVLTTNLLQSLFISLKDDAIAFLAGIWVVGTSDNLNPVKAIALLHAAAFLEAHVSENDGVDFQTILPSLLVALQIPDSQVCQGALECISRIRILAGRRLTSIYRFDIIYRECDQTLQYLDQDDLKRYLNALAEHHDHFINDTSYIRVFHEQHLNRSKADKKREFEYKHRVTCFLLSHINSSSCEHVQVVLLKSLATVVEKAKSLIMLPTIEALSKEAEAVEPPNIFTVASEELIVRALSCFDNTSASYLNAKEDAWERFLRVLRTYFRPGTPASVQEALSHALEGGLFSALNHQRKLVICEILLDIGAQEPSNSGPRNVLKNVLAEVPLMVQLLGSLSPAGIGGSPRATKRAKTVESPEGTVLRLTLLVEILGTKSLPGSLELITHLLDTLNKVIQSPPSSPNDVGYIEQLLMSAIESAASKITVPNISPSVIRLEILVELIRVSGNPQTFHQALLLMANLARLAPESVLFNVMPIFTFMGSNVFHRDDTYSFKVVQQTIDGIVPVMAESLREAHSGPLGLYIGSREFLRVFTDAAHHIPRHRRNNFFIHLVDVLGSRDFLPPISMLLVEKNANRIVRQQPDEVQNSLALPISLFQHSDFDQQKYAANQVLEEVQRLVARIIDANPQPIFLEGTTEGDHSVSSSTLLKRRSQALVTFVGYALKGRTSNSTPSCEEHAISSIIAKLIILATLREGNTLDTKIEDISQAARASMNRLLNHMSVVDFIQSVEAMLGSRDVEVEAGALELLAKRLPHVSSKARQEISGAINNILGLIKNLLSNQKHDRVVAFAFQSVQAIADAMCPGEESSLTDLVPSTLAVALSADYMGFALAALPTILVKLGPRIIPFFRQAVSQAITVLRGNESGLFGDALATLNALLSTIPTFWGNGEVSQLVHLYIDSSSKVTTSAPLTKVIKSAAKRLPAKVLLPTLLELWSSLEVSGDIGRISAYFEVLSRGLQHAERPVVLENLRPTFNIFLVALDIVKTDEKAESRVIAAFKELVVKLNEAAFKPLFRRLFDWAFAEETADIARKVTFGRLYITLLNFFKGLVVPYMSFLLQPFNDILKSFTTSFTVDLALWSSVLQVLTHSLNYDDGAFWRDDKLRQLSSALTSQIEVCIRLNFVEGKLFLEECLGAFVENAMDDTLLKTINLNILMYTRSEDSRVRIFALTCADALWRSHSNKMLGFVAETATFIAECGEDDNDVVVKESFRLKDAVESVAGKIDGL